MKLLGEVTHETGKDIINILLKVNCVLCIFILTQTADILEVLALSWKLLNLDRAIEVEVEP